MTTMSGDHRDGVGHGVACKDAREVAALEKDLASAQGREARVEEWTHTHGAALCPPGADTYGEGMRDAKQQVRAILRGGGR